MAKYPTTWNGENSESSMRYPYLRFDAFSFKDLLNSYLSQNSEFTDHIYPGSNLSILVDCLSELFASLAFNLNNAASESMLSDSMVYKNINRLVKFLGYCPHGYKASTADVNASAVSNSNTLGSVVVPKYSTISLNETDSYGRAICFSTTDYFYINSGLSNSISLVNGKWKYYGATFKSTGEPNEKFVLNSINKAGTDSEYVAFPYVDVYVKRHIGGNAYRTIYFKPSVEGVYIESRTGVLNTADDRKFELRINENGIYEIEFGDGIHGAKLSAGDVIHVVYLKSNGPDGEIPSGKISNKRFTTEIDGISYSSTDSYVLTMKDILEITPISENTIVAFADVIGEYDSDYSKLDSTKEFFYGCTNYSQSTKPCVQETADQIRENAPNWFKRIGRAITIEDYTSYIKSNFFSDIVDVVVMNNYQYASKFFKWLWFLGKEKVGDPRKWINPSISSLGIYGYKYSDAADANNVYIWIKQNTDSTSVGKRIVDSLQNIKPLTSEPVILSAVNVNFAICAWCPTENAGSSSNYQRTFYNRNGSSTTLPFVYDDGGRNRLEVEISSGLNVSASIVKNRVLSVFKNFFSTDSMNIGDTVSVSNLEAEILAIDGIKRVRTIYRNAATAETVIRNGISMAHWNDSIVDGYDFDISNANVVLEPFQYPQYYDMQTLADRIDVVINGTSNLTQDSVG